MGERQGLQFAAIVNPHLPSASSVLFIISPPTPLQHNRKNQDLITADAWFKQRIENRVHISNPSEYPGNPGSIRTFKRG